MDIGTIINILFLICSLGWLIYCSKDYLKFKRNEGITDDEKKNGLKKNRTLIILWSIVAVLCMVSIVLDLTGLGDVPVFPI